MFVIRHTDVEKVLSGREGSVIDVVADAYARFDAGAAAVPHSVFLRFPGDTSNRIIGLPAYIGGAGAAAGMKWVASFPGNLTAGMPRAHAVIVLNSLRTGRPEVLLEGSMISAWRTAASAALAARELTATAPDGVTFVGCGVINAEVLRFLVTIWPGLGRVMLYDTDPGRATAFAGRCRELLPRAQVEIAATRDDALAAHGLVSVATTATTPHMGLDACRPGAVVLHVSLRDLVVPAMLESINVVDDADHVSRENTSVHLAERESGGRDFIHASIGALLRGRVTLPRHSGRRVVFSPFGLGSLDIALASYVARIAQDLGLCVPVDDFFPAPGS
ncbi:2,3-diaminopropionate biosynthesis protein SbnB [Nonomuraea sp. NPDC052116]|uniref:2,3-diaminopropionate biosynthesis protein SbnB n=1 Tax=Nonomuraea sp. NPDC052116 TaxID=3155665 RepID=UPI0034359581